MGRNPSRRAYIFWLKVRAAAAAAAAAAASANASTLR